MSVNLHRLNKAENTAEEEEEEAKKKQKRIGTSLFTHKNQNGVNVTTRSSVNIVAFLTVHRNTSS